MTQMIRETRPQVKPRPARRPFGSGVLPTCPAHRAPADFDSMSWWAAQTQDAAPAGWEVEMARDEELMLSRRFAEYEAQMRLDAGLDC